MIAALFVETDGCYFNQPGVDPWDITRDARTYPGPHPVVAHPPCQRWGRYWHGSPCKPHQFKLGDDAGCFAAAYEIVKRFGGVLEHPAYSHAWAHHGIPKPAQGAGWLHIGGNQWTCYVEQGHYGHPARKATWLFYVGPQPPELIWSRSPQRLCPRLVARVGYKKAVRCGAVGMLGGAKARNKTPTAFRDVLIQLANLSTQDLHAET